MVHTAEVTGLRIVVVDVSTFTLILKAMVFGIRFAHIDLDFLIFLNFCN